MDEQIDLGVKVNSKDVDVLAGKFNKVDESLQSVLSHLSELEKKIKDLSSAKVNIGKSGKATSSKETVHIAKNTYYSSANPESKGFKQATNDFHKYQEEQIKYIQEQIRTQERITSNQKKLAEAEAKTAKAKLLMAQKAEDKNSPERRKAKSAWTEMITGSRNFRAYREKHPEYFITGGQNASPRVQTSRALGEIGNKVGSLGAGGRVAGDLMSIAGSMLKAPAVGFATALAKGAEAVIDFSKAAVQAYSEIQSIKTQLGVVFSNETQANAMFGEISQYAVKSPFGVQQTSELAVLLKQSGVYASDLMNTLRMIGDTAGGNMEKMKRIANNYAQIVSIGKASMLDMRQFAYAGIPIFEAISKELGVSQQELRKLISDGKVTSDIVEKVFKDLTGVNGIFENATAKGAKTLKARLQNLADAKQLAMANAGQYIAGIGTQYGNDSILNKFVDMAEGFFSWMEEKFNLTNIEKDVNTIAQSNKRIDALEKLLEQAESMGDKDLVNIIKSELDYQKSLYDVDKIRAIYAESYDIKNSKLQDYGRQFGTMRESDVAARLSDTRREYVNLSNRLNEEIAGRSQGFGSAMTDEELEKMKAQILVYGELIESLESFKKAIDESKKTTEEEIKANRERNLLNAQQSAFDSAKKVVDQKTSFTSSFDQLYSMWTSSDEYKKQQEEEQRKTLEEAQKLLKELDNFVDDLGNVDLPALVQQMGFGNYNEFINKTGALDPSRKLNVVEGKSDLQMTQDRKLLLNQWLAVSGKIENELGRKGQWEAINQFGRSSAASQLNDAKTNKQFFDNFSKILTNQLDILKSLAVSSKTDTDKQYYAELYNSLLGSTYEFNVNTKGKDAKIETAARGAVQEFISLWKRILASSTGLSTQGMTGTKQTIENYRDDMAIRNMTSGVLTAALKTMGIDSAMGLVKTSGNALKLKGDTGYTYQVDWKETKKALHDFATQLSASTEVISAYKKGLEDELNAYQELIAAGYTQSESQDLNQQKFVSSKTYEKLADSGSQLVNAFGEVLETAEGLQVSYNTKTNKWTDSNGNEVQVEQLKMTGKLFELIKEEMPRLRQELHEANVAEAKNKVLNGMSNSVFDTRILKQFIQTQTYDDKLSFLMENSEYYKTVLTSGLEELKTIRKEDKTLKYSSLKDKTVDDILIQSSLYQSKGFEELLKRQKELDEKAFDPETELSTGALSREEEKEYNEITSKINVIKQSYEAVNEALESAVEDSASLLKSDEYKSLLQLKQDAQKDKIRTNALMNITNFAQYGNSNPNARNLSPEHYEGWRGAKARFLKYGYGASRDYDMEDLYIQAAKQRNLAGQNKNQFGIDTDKFLDADGNLKAEFLGEEGEKNLLNALTEADKEIIKMNQSLMDTSDIFVQLGNDITKAFTDLGKGVWEKPFEKLGENLMLSKEASEGLDDIFKSLTASLLNAAGEAMVKAGWDLVSRGALDGNYAMIAGGLALAAAGGFVSGIGSGMTQKKDDQDDSDKLNKLKDDLLALLRQAREDSIYYENTLRHKRAISSNDSLNVKNVHDAIITPRGDVVNTDPKDYLIATKTPKTLVGGGSPTINFNVIDKSTGIVVTQQKSTYDSETNTIDFEAIIESKVQEVIATTKGDDAFAAREMRINGRQVIA